MNVSVLQLFAPELLRLIDPQIVGGMGAVAFSQSVFIEPGEYCLHGNLNDDRLLLRKGVREAKGAHVIESHGGHRFGVSPRPRTEPGRPRNLQMVDDVLQRIGQAQTA